MGRADIPANHQPPRSPERPSPELAVRLLRAKAAELEARVKHGWERAQYVDTTAADISLVCELLADHIERCQGAGPAPAPAPAPVDCLAARHGGEPRFEGAHPPHNFTYGPGGRFSGHCAGRDGGEWT